MRNIEKKQRRELALEEKRRKQDLNKRRRARNKEYILVSWFFVLIFVLMIAYIIRFNAVESDEFINSPYNTRQDTFADRVVRGTIMSADEQVLAKTEIYDGGYEERVYPYSNVFAHVVGYDSNGKSGLESEANFLLLSSHEYFVDQMKNQLRGNKNMGDTVISTLESTLQTTAYYALGDRKGAVVALEPSTGKILAMVSKPDFDPNYMEENWDWLINDSSNSSLLNRATSGQYPPGSTFKIVTTLDYIQSRGRLESYSYYCEGLITKDEHSIRCYNGTVHGQEDFSSAFASSCNCFFAEMGIELGGASLRDTAESLLFNKTLPLESSRKSEFSLDKNSETPLIMQTAIGQGNTLVSPIHMAMITSAIANDGVLMKPYLIDKVVNDTGDLVKKRKPESYKRLMSSSEAEILQELMDDVTEYGTASALNGRGYKTAGKTGSAEYDENGSSHSWFVGYCENSEGNPGIAVAIIVEGGGTGSAAAVPIAAQIFDTYYWS